MPWREATDDDGENAVACGCHIWTGYTDPRGMPVVRTTTSSTTARRAAWERENGPVPRGRILIAMCHEQLCVRPSHAEPVTRAEWQYRRGWTKASRHLRRRVVRLKAQGWSVRRTARALDVSHATVGRVLNGEYFDPASTPASRVSPTPGKAIDR